MTAASEDQYRHARLLLSAAATTAAAAMRPLVARLDPELATACGYHLGWVEASGAPVVGSGGKAVRPALALAGAVLVEADGDIGVRCAAAVELLHNFTLIHDDVMDGDVSRRGRPTVWAQFGVPAAVLAGDALLALTVATIAEIDTPTRRGGALFADTLLRVVRGQQQDLTFKSRPFTGADAVTVEEYLVMAGNKTGALLGCALALPAAITPTIPTTVVDALYRAGRHLGLAFQAVDDILGLWGNPAVTGKAVYSDLRAGKKTLPIITALAADATGTLARALTALPDDNGDADRRTAAAAITDAGGQAATLALAHDETTRAMDYLQATGIPRRYHHDLLALTAFALGRSS